MSKVNDDGGQAFPCAGYDGLDRCEDGVQGMTLRDYFAAKAMQGYVAGKFGHTHKHPDDHEVAEEAYAIADAMLAERSRREAQGE